MGDVEDLHISTNQAIVANLFKKSHLQNNSSRRDRIAELDRCVGVGGQTSVEAGSLSEHTSSWTDPLASQSIQSVANNNLAQTDEYSNQTGYFKLLSNQLLTE